MKKARLQKVVDYLRKVRIEIAKGLRPEFDMDEWLQLKDPGVFKNKKTLECATAACAIGHVAHLFNKQGFKLELDKIDNRVTPVYKGFIDFDALQEFFDIDRATAMALFHPDYYADEDGYEYSPTVSQVADKIENVIHGIEE